MRDSEPQLHVEPGGRDTAPFDPAVVPRYPLLRIELRGAAEGGFEGLVDDVVVARDEDLEVVRQAVIGEAAALAGKRTGTVRAIRVQGTWSDQVFALIVTSAGEVIPDDDSAQGTPGSETSSTPGAEQGPRNVRGLVLTGAILLVPLLVVLTPLVVLVVQAMSGNERHAAAPPAPQPTQLPAVAPGGYDAVAAWSAGLGDSAMVAATQIDADDDRVYVSRQAGKEIAAYDTATGVPSWRYDGLDAAVALGPTLTSVQGDRLLAIASMRQLVLLDPVTGRVEHSWELASTSSVRVTPTGPVVQTDPQHVDIVVDGQLVPRVLPASGKVIGPGDDGTLVVASDAGQVWTVSGNDVAGDPITLTVPPRCPGFDGVVGWTGARLVLACQPPADGSNLVRLVGFAAGTWVQDWASKPVPAVYTAALDQMGVKAAPTGKWGIYGVTAIDLETGVTAQLPDTWTTTVVGDEFALGIGDQKPLVATLTGVTDASARAPGIESPTTPQAIGGSRPFLIASTGTGKSVLYALRPTSSESEGAP